MQQKIAKIKEGLNMIYVKHDLHFSLTFKNFNNDHGMSESLVSLKNIISLQNVLKLSLSSCSIDSAQLSSLLFECRSLQALNLVNCEKICNGFIKALSSCAQLRSLVLVKQPPLQATQHKVANITMFFILSINLKPSILFPIKFSNRNEYFDILNKLSFNVSNLNYNFKNSNKFLTLFTDFSKLDKRVLQFRDEKCYRGRLRGRQRYRGNIGV